MEVITPLQINTEVIVLEVGIGFNTFVTIEGFCSVLEKLLKYVHMY